MAPPGVMTNVLAPMAEFFRACKARWGDSVSPEPVDAIGHARLACQPTVLPAICNWLVKDLNYVFTTLVAEESASEHVTLTYVFSKDSASPWLQIAVPLAGGETIVPSVSEVIHAADWHEREVEDLFGIRFQGHPRLGEFVLHEDWPEGINPMRHAFDARQVLQHRDDTGRWEAPTIVTAPGAFAMPIGPIFSDFAESAHFLLETVGEDVIHTIPRFFYKYRGIEKLAEGLPIDRVLLIAERFSGIAAFAHGLALCQAVEAIAGAEVPPRGAALRSLFAELERLRHHAATITGICHSTALVVAASQAALIEEELLRLSAIVTGHRYLFGLVAPGGITRDVAAEQCRLLETSITALANRLRALQDMLRVSSSFLDRLEEVGVVTTEAAHAYGLLGPIARASGISRDMRALFPYAAYDGPGLMVPIEQEGDGYARLRVLFREAEQSAAIVRRILSDLPPGELKTDVYFARPGVALGVVEAPHGAAFHWVRLSDSGVVERYRVTPPSFANWHGFHLAAENFAFQDFPIILASFGLSNAECDR